MAERNLAYDLDRYNNYDADVKEKAELKVVKSTKKKTKPVFAICAYIITIAILVVIVATQAAITEVSYEISKANSILNEANSESVRLDMEIEQKISKRNIEDKAGTLLGLSREDNKQVEYISVSRENVTVLNKDNMTVFDKVSEAFRSVLEYINNFFNNNDI
ncbi:MAG: hypothetical protein ACRCZK_03610 [Oscillospiraceae bacterium]